MVEGSWEPEVEVSAELECCVCVWLKSRSEKKSEFWQNIISADLNLKFQDPENQKQSDPLNVSQRKPFKFTQRTLKEIRI